MVAPIISADATCLTNVLPKKKKKKKKKSAQKEDIRKWVRHIVYKNRGFQSLQILTSKVMRLI